MRLGSLAFVLVLSLAPAAHADFAIRDGVLVEADGAPFVMRGVNVPHAWLNERTAQSLEDVAATGANTVRIVLSNGARWRRSEPREVSRLIAMAKRRRMIVMLEVHDTTGFGADPRAVHLETTLAYWRALRPALQGQEDYVLVNIGNEPFAGTSTPDMWVDAHRDMISALRALGLRHTIVVDAHDYGQDSSNTMRDRARELFDADPLRNVLFSVHMYQVYGEGDRIRAYFDAFRDARLPLIVGEFGPDHQGEPVDEDTIFALSAERGIGYLGWSWSGNSRNVANLDIVEGFDARRPSPWGRRLIDGPGGFRETARPAGLFVRESALRRFATWFSAH